jgi:peptidoglycan/LPS O-acetylase OafA/YrhL
MGALQVAHLSGVTAMAGSRSPHRILAIVVRFLANHTFSIYLYHLPIASFLITLVPWPPGSLAGRCAILRGTMGGCFLLAQFTERKKHR